MGDGQGAVENVAMTVLAPDVARGLPSLAFWQDKRVLLTGHTGFKGGWLALWLKRLGAHVTGLALLPDTVPNLFTAASVSEGLDSHICDIRDAAQTKAITRAARADIVLHLAAQPLVRESYLRPIDTFSTNVMGAVHVLDALRNDPTVKVAVMITTDKVYTNREWVYPYREDDALGGHDPYSASKAASELAIASYRLSFLDAQGVAVGAARAGNVIGGGDWSKDRLIPDAVRAWEIGAPLNIRSPGAVRPWQHVLEPLSAYLVLAERLWHDHSLAGAYNIGPDSADMASVRQVVTLARTAYGRGEIEFAETGPDLHEAGLLTLENVKARSLLGIAPRWELGSAIERTLRWYDAFAKGARADGLCHADITAYEELI